METSKEPAQDEVEFDPKSLIGITLADRYEIVKQIGRGGMGVVYLARQSALSRDVVVKILSPSLVDDKAAMARFEREARGLSRLQHPNIVTIFDFGRDGNQAFIAMEYVQGVTLSRFLRKQKKKQPLSLAEFATIAVQILKGIGEAHKLGLIHRDIKPTNIMLCELEGQQNFVKILDFGLAKLVRNPADSVTKEQHLVGSAAFLSPEQILNGDSNSRSDVYALGVLFYLMLTGKRPFKAENDAVLLYKHVNEEPPSLEERLPEDHDIPPAIVRLVERCLSKDPNDRPADANAVLAALSGTLSSNLARVPWASGEFTPVPGVGEAPTSLHLTSQMLPASPQNEAPTPPSISRADTYNSLDFSGISKQMTGQSQVIMVQQGPSKKAMLITIVAVALVAAVAAIIAVNAFSDKEAPAAVATDDAEKEKEATASSLERVGELIDEGKLGKAESLLESVSEDARGFPELVEKAADYKERINTGRLLVKARSLRDGGDVKNAIITYEDLLARDPSHTEARAELDEVRASAAADKLAGFLSLTGTAGATVMVNGEERGKLPTSLELQPGVHSVAVKKEGHKTFSREIEILAAGTVTLDAALEKQQVATTNTQKKRDKKRSNTRDKKRDSKDKDTEKTAAAEQDATRSDNGQTSSDKGSQGDSDSAVQQADNKADAQKSDSSDEDKKKRGEGLLLPVGDKGKDKENDEDDGKRKGGDLLLPR